MKKNNPPPKKPGRRPAQLTELGRGPAQLAGPPPAGKPGRPSYLGQAVPGPKEQAGLRVVAAPWYPSAYPSRQCRNDSISTKRFRCDDFWPAQTTAGKATWTAALGSHQGANRTTAPSKAFSSRDLPAHLTLKTRQTGQNTVDEVSRIRSIGFSFPTPNSELLLGTQLARRDLKAELEEKERKHFEKVRSNFVDSKPLHCAL